MEEHWSKPGLPNLLLVAGQTGRIFKCKFITGRNRCSNQSNVLMQGSLKISVSKTDVL